MKVSNKKRRTGKKEDKLDTRMREVYESAASARPPKQQQPQSTGTGNFAYTKMSAASPINGRGMMTNNNIPMSYGGPPTVAEMNRNLHRKDYTRSTVPLADTQLVPPVNYNVAFPSDELSSELLDPA